jgi:hypothetical protein
MTAELEALAVKPVRVQLSRRKGWRMPANTVSVARPGRFGNPFKHPEMLDGTPWGQTRARHHAVEDFRDALEEGSLVLPLEELRGKNLACWCPLLEPCHADVLLELANPAPPQHPEVTHDT